MVKTSGAFPLEETTYGRVHGRHCRGSEGALVKVWWRFSRRAVNLRFSGDEAWQNTVGCPVIISHSAGPPFW